MWLNLNREIKRNEVPVAMAITRCLAERPNFEDLKFVLSNVNKVYETVDDSDKLDKLAGKAGKAGKVNTGFNRSK